LSCYMLSFPPTFSHFASITAHSHPRLPLVCLFYLLLSWFILLWGFPPRDVSMQKIVSISPFTNWMSSTNDWFLSTSLSPHWVSDFTSMLLAYSRAIFVVHYCSSFFPSLALFHTRKLISMRAIVNAIHCLFYLKLRVHDSWQPPLVQALHLHNT